MSPNDLLGAAGAVPWPLYAAAVLAVTAPLVITGRALSGRPARESREEREQRHETLATLTVATAAAVLSGQSLWRFAGDVLGWEGPLRILPFVALDAAVVTLAKIARRRIRSDRPAGLPGALMWALAAFSGLLGTFEARSVAEGIARAAFPLIAAVLWHFGSLEQQREGHARPDRRVGMVRWLHPVERLRVAFELGRDRHLSEAEATAAVRADRAAWRLYRLHVTHGKAAWRYRLAHRAAQREALRVRLDDPEAARRVLPRLRVLAQLPAIADGATVASVTNRAVQAERSAPEVPADPRPEEGAATAEASQTRTGSGRSRRTASTSGGTRTRTGQAAVPATRQGEADQVERVRALAAEHGGALSVRQVRGALGVRAEKAQRLMDAAGVTRTNRGTGGSRTATTTRTGPGADQTGGPELGTDERGAAWRPFALPDLSAEPERSGSALVGPEGRPATIDGRTRE